MNILVNVLQVIVCSSFIHFSNSGSIHLHSSKHFNQISEGVNSMNNSEESYDVKYYKIDLEASDTSIFIKGSASILLEITESQVNQIPLDLVKNYTIDSILAGGLPVMFQHNSDTIFITFATPLSFHQNVLITVYYHGKGYNSGTGAGIYNSEFGGTHKKYTWSLSEPFSAKNWFPCKQVLTDKADSVAVNITTDASLKAGSNGLLVKIVDLPNGKVRYEWKSGFPIAYYLISFSLGDYLDYSFYTKTPDGDSILVQNYVYNDSAFFSQNKANLDVTREFLNCFGELLGKYPFAKEKYGHCLVPFGGGMEHQTMTTISNTSYNLISHELMHQWFGDLVTCATWQDIWINEGFASYGEYLALERLKSKSSADLWMASAHSVAKGITDGSVYIPNSESLSENRIFSLPLSYKKGAAILHMIRQEVNDDALFFELLKEFLVLHKDANATGEDFEKLLNQKTGKDFTDFFQQWYYGEGYPTFKINWHSAKDTLFFYSLQETTSSATPLFNTLLEFSVQLPQGKDTLISFRQERNYQEFRIYMPYNIQGLTFDPDKWLLASLDSFIHSSDQINPKSLYTASPNPVNEKLNVWFKQVPAEYTYYIINMEGGIEYNSRSKNRHLEIDFRYFDRGNYLLIILVNNEFNVTKVLKL